MKKSRKSEDSKLEKQVKHLITLKKEAGARIRRGFALGANIAIGSDAGAYMVPHGKGIVQEWGAFRQILGDSEEVKEWLETGEKEIRDRFKRK